MPTATNCEYFNIKLQFFVALKIESPERGNFNPYLWPAMTLKVIYNELELLEKTANGDEQAFSDLFYTFHQELGDYVFRLTRSLPMAEEIVQDTFLKIWVRREELSEVRNFRAYLFTLSRNHAFNMLRNEARQAALDKDWADHYPILEEQDAVSNREKLFGFIEEAISLLPPQQQKVWKMSREDGLKHEEIAQELQLSRETVKRHISLALAAISRYVRQNADTVFGILVALLRPFFS